MHHVCMHGTFNSILPNLGEAMSTLGQLAAGSRCTLLLDIEHAVTELKRRGVGEGWCSTDTWQLPSPGQCLWKLPLTQPDSCPAPPLSPSPVISIIYTCHQRPEGGEGGYMWEGQG